MPALKQQILNSDKLDHLVWQSSTPDWTITNSFSAAYLIWDRSENLATSRLESEREFDYGEFPLEQFYNLVLETNLEFDSKIEQEATIGIEVNKNPFVLSGEEIGILESPRIDASFLPSPYLSQDFISKKNYLGLFIEHEILLSDRLSLEFEGTFDVAISDTTDFRELPSVEPIERNNFYPELSLNYELSDRLFLYTTAEYSAESVEGTDFNNRSFNSEIYRGIELGIETEFNNNWLATLSFYHETQENFTTINPNKPDFDLQIDRQSSNSWTGEIQGEITSGWWLYGFYTYTNATVTEDEAIEIGSSVVGVARHSAGFWTSYEIPQGVWQGLGFGGGILANGDRSAWATPIRPRDTENRLTLPSYLQTDAAIFYSQDNFRAAVSVQNLFDGREDKEVLKRSLFSTLWFQF